MTKSPPQGDRRQRLGRRASDLIIPSWRDLVDGAAQPVLVHKEFQILYANPACAALYGYADVDALLALPSLLAVIPPADQESARAYHHGLLTGAIPAVTRRVEHIRADSTPLWLNAIDRVIDWHGEPAVQVSLLDISAQIAAEQALRASEQRLQAVLEILPYPIYIARIEDGQLLFVNRKCSLLFGGSATDLLQEQSARFYQNPDDRRNLRDLLQQVGEIRDIEVGMQTRTGRQFIAELAAITTDYAGEAAVIVALNDISQRKALEAELLHQARTDALTGISNRRDIIQFGEQEFRRARRFARPLAVALADIDYFKSINDRHGHEVGDVTLQTIAKSCANALRATDRIGRYGGEEFIIILPETELAAANDTAERLRARLEQLTIATSAGPIHCTLSFGVTRMVPTDADLDATIRRADEALYRAKRNGRNRVEVLGDK